MGLVPESCREEAQVTEWLEAGGRDVDWGASGQEVSNSLIYGSDLSNYAMEKDHFDEEWAATASHGDV